MRKQDLHKLGREYMRNALELRFGESVWLEYYGPKCLPLAKACSDIAAEIGANVFLIDRGSEQINAVATNASVQRLLDEGQRLQAIMRQMEKSLIIRDDTDAMRNALTPDQKQAYEKYVSRDLSKIRMEQVQWMICRAPTDDFRKITKLKKDAFEQMFLDVNLQDYARMAHAAQPLKKVMAEGRDVQIKAPDTDLHFSIKDVPAKDCVGRRNRPDGEVYTAPVKDSVNGTIRFGKSFYKGERFETIFLRFQNGYVVEATAETPERTKALNAILDLDEGARYVGEFAIAFNPDLTEPTGVILFDEKIAGSLHLALGKALPEADNGNDSVIHWDMVQIQRPEHGGGEIWIDDELIRKDGLFVRPDLKGLNPDQLMPGNDRACATGRTKMPGPTGGQCPDIV